MLKYRANWFCGAVLMGKSFPNQFATVTAKLFIGGRTYSRSHQGNLEIFLCLLIRAYADSSAMESIALRALLAMPALLLQNSNHRSKMKYNSLTLERRLKHWFDGNVDSCFHDSRTIQLRLPPVSKPTKSNEKTGRSFSQLLMMLGKVKSALQLLTDSSKGGVMLLDATLLEGSSKRTVRDALLEKHPAPSAITHSAPNPDSHVPHPVLFYAIDGPFVRSVVLKMDSAAGPGPPDWMLLMSMLIQIVFVIPSGSLLDTLQLNMLIQKGSKRLLPVDSLPLTSALVQDP